MTLPIEEYLPKIHMALHELGAVVVKAEPGAGKTTQLPLFLTENFQKRVLVLEPRRLAAQMAATHVAKQAGCQLGEEVGYHIRYDKKYTDSTKLIFVTEAMALRYFQSDNSLSKFDIVVIDEFHERNLHTDMALAVLQWIRKNNRANLKIVVMSATLAGKQLVDYFGSAKFFDVPGRTYPVEIIYLPQDAETSKKSSVLRSLEMIEEKKHLAPHVLVFLSGIREILELESQLSSELRGKGWDVLPLASELKKDQQQRVFQKSDRRKIILTTNVAETSLTIPGVGSVVDFGYAKIAATAQWSGMPTLEVKAISQASCIQRSGRAGRTSAGLALRIFDETSFKQRDPYTLPEIKRLELTQVLLLLAGSFSSAQDAVANLQWYEAPDEQHVENALEVLRLIGALDELGHITEIGNKIADWPVHPRLGRVLLEGIRDDRKDLAAFVVALLEVGDFRAKSKAKELFSSDLIPIMKAIIEEDEDLSELIADATKKKVTKSYKSILSSLGIKPTKLTLDPENIAKWILKGFPDRVACLRPDKNKKRRGPQKYFYNFCRGRGGELSPQSWLQPGEFIIALDVTERVKGFDAAKAILIHAATIIEKKDLLADTCNRLYREEFCEKIDPDSGSKKIYAVKHYGQLRIDEELVESSKELTSDELFDYMKKNFPAPFSDQGFLDRYHAKAKIINIHCDTVEMPIFEGEFFEILLSDLCYEAETLEDIRQKDPEEILKMQLSNEQLEFLEKLPDRLSLANGKKLTIDYSDSQKIRASGFIQDFYGLHEHPSLLSGKLPLSIELLGPHKRPIQVTSDIISFWNHIYRADFASLSRRYPKHYWPENPIKATPVLLKRNR